MAEANLTVGVEVELRPDENTSRWLESLGWIRPDAPSTESVVSELEPDDDEEDYDPRPMELQQSEPGQPQCKHWQKGTPCDWDVCRMPEIPPARPLRTGRGRAMGGAEAMRYRARQLRTRLRGELADEGAQNDLDELLRMCDVDVKRIFAEDTGD